MQSEEPPKDPLFQLDALLSAARINYMNTDQSFAEYLVTLRGLINDMEEKIPRCNRTVFESLVCTRPFGHAGTCSHYGREKDS